MALFIHKKGQMINLYRQSSKNDVFVYNPLATAHSRTVECIPFAMVYEIQYFKLPLINLNTAIYH